MEITGCHPDPVCRVVEITEYHLGVAVIDSLVIDQLELIETSQRSRFPQKGFGGLHQAGLDAPPPMMCEIEPPRFVLGDEIRRILWLEPAEVVATRKHEDIAGEAISPDVGDLPCSIWPEL